MVAATAVDVAAIDDIPAGNLQVVLGKIYGKAQWAADTVGQVGGTAQWAADTAGAAQGTAQYAADNVGFLDYHIRQIGALVGYTVPAAQNSLAKSITAALAAVPQLELQEQADQPAE